MVVVSGGSAWKARKMKFSASTMNRLGFAAVGKAGAAAAPRSLVDPSM